MTKSIWAGRLVARGAALALVALSLLALTVSAARALTIPSARLSVKLPAVPKVKVPSVNVPSVAPPHVSLPSVHVSIPTVSIPGSAGSGASAGSGSAGSVPGVPGELATAAIFPTDSGSAGAQSTGQSSGGAQSGSSGTASAANASDNASSAAAASAARKWRRYLRAVVLRLSGCLSVLSRQDQQVLSWRAGVGVDHRYSRLRVAHTLGVTVTRERQLEHGAVADLLSAASTYGCGSAEAVQPSSVSNLVGGVERTVALVAGVGGSPVIGPSPLLVAEASSSSAPGSENSGGHGSSSGATTVESGSIPPLNEPSSRSSDNFMLELSIVLAVLIMLALLGPPGTKLRLRYWRQVAVEAVSGIGATAIAAGTNGAEPDADAKLEREAASDDGEEALAVYKRGDEKGNPVATLMLGRTLEKQGDLTGARMAYRRANRRGDPKVAEAARAALRLTGSPLPPP